MWTRLLVSFVLLLAGSLAHAAGDPDFRPLDPRGVDNLTAFTRLLGVVRYFHPSDEAAQIDWEAFTVGAIDTVERATTPAELVRTLRGLFLPIAPSLRLDVRPVVVEASSLLPAGARATAVVEWWHRGYGASTITDGPFSSTRLRTPPDQRAKDARPVGTAFTQNLGGGVWCSIPMVLWADASGTLPHADLALPSDGRESWEAVRRSVRLADVALLWNVAEHFYPYFDVAGNDWNTVLTASLARAARDLDPESFRETLERMVARLHDGQGWVSGHEDRYMLPLAWSWVGDRLVVRAVAERLEDPPRVGDIVLSIDGRPISEIATRARERVSGATADYVSYLTARKLCFSPTARDVDLELLGSGGRKRHVHVDYGDPRRLSSVKPPAPAPPEPVPGVAYVDLERLEEGDLPTLLERLMAARAIVFDVRGLPSGAAFSLLSHLSDQPLHMPRMGVPMIFEPDRASMAFDEVSKTISPESPRIAARKVFLIGPASLSPGETFMSTVEQSHLGEFVGAPTLGTSGALVKLELPGGYTVRLTGARVLKPDGSRNQGIGVAPNVTVNRTVAGIATGRDEVLEKAIEILESRSGK